MDSAEAIAATTALSDGAVGGLVTATVTSSPELVTTVAAVRAGALTLAVGNIGTNCFNTLVIAAADAAHRPGSIYHAISEAQLAWGVGAILMTAIILLGMVRRETFGVGRIGSRACSSSPRTPVSQSWRSHRRDRYVSIRT